MQTVELSNRIRPFMILDTKTFSKEWIAQLIETSKKWQLLSPKTETGVHSELKQIEALLQVLDTMYNKLKLFAGFARKDKSRPCRLTKREMECIAPALVDFIQGLVRLIQLVVKKAECHYTDQAEIPVEEAALEAALSQVTEWETRMKQSCAELQAKWDEWHGFVNVWVEEAPMKGDQKHPFVSVFQKKSPHPLKKQEDQYSYAPLMYDHHKMCMWSVYDGHGGQKAALFTRAELPGFIQRRLTFFKQSVAYASFSDYERIGMALGEACMDCDVEWTLHTELKDDSGSTVVVALVCETLNSLWSVNLGDSELWIGQRQGPPKTLMTCHTGKLASASKPDGVDYKRIYSAGGAVVRGRVNLSLTVTRAMGDRSQKISVFSNPYTNDRPYDFYVETWCVTSCPDVHRESLDIVDYIVMGSDGMFDAIKGPDAVDFVGSWTDRKSSAEQLVTKASEAGSRDDITALVVYFRPPIRESTAHTSSTSLSIVSSSSSPKSSLSPSKVVSTPSRSQSTSTKTFASVT
jgi:serine/threonine protein phosphatase PrpC